MDPIWEQFGSTWLFYLQSALTIGMLIHAFRSGAEYFWFFIIFLLQPIGAWVYFFVVFLRSVSFGRRSHAQPPWQRRLSLNELRYRAERMPTVINRTALAQRLMEKGSRRKRCKRAGNSRRWSPHWRTNACSRSICW